MADAEQAQFGAILELLMSTDNEARQDAEAKYESIPPEKKGQFLLAVLCQEAVPEEVRVLCAVLLRRLFTNDFDTIWHSKLQAEGQQFVKQNMMALLAKETENLVMRKKIAEVLAELIRNLIDDDGNNTWPECVQFVFQLASTNSVPLKENSLILLSLVPGLFGNQQANYLDHIKQMLSQSISHELYEVKFLAAKALANFVLENEKDENVLRHFQDLIPQYLAIMTESVNKEEDDQLLKLTIEIIGLAPKFFRPYLGNLMELCLHIGKQPAESVSDEWRHLALEIATTAAENIPGAVKKTAGHLIPQYIELLLHMMTDQEEESDWAESDEPVEEDSDGNPAMAESTLDRLACALGGKTVLPIVMQQGHAMLASPEWSHRYGGLMAVSAVGEGCSKQMEAILPQIVEPVLNFLVDPHPRVRYAACNALGQMASDFAPGYEKKFHSKILPGLTNLFDDSCPRVQAHAGAALVNFCEECPKEILKNYSEPLLGKLEACFSVKIKELQEMSKKLVLEQLVTTVAAIATTLEQDFAPYYNRFMPCMKYIMENANSAELRTLRGKTIECASLIGLAVGAERFTADASEIMNLLLRTQVDNGGIELDDDDPQLSYMITAWARICQILGPSFAPYLPMVMAPVLRTASVQPEFQVLEADEAKDMEGHDDWELIPVGDSQNVGLHTAKLEDKAMACQMLVCYARVMKEHFRPYVDEVVKLVVPLLKFYFHEGVRSSAAEILPHLIRSVASNPTDMAVLWERVKTDLLIATEAEPETEVKVEQLHALSLCVELLPPEAMDVPTIQKITTVVEKVFVDHFERSEERAEQRKDEDFDEVLEQQLWDEMEDDNYILTKAADVIHEMLKVHKANYLPYMESGNIIGQVDKLIKPERYWQERQWGICIWDDVMEFTGQAALKYQQFFVPSLLSFLADSSSEVRQAAAYGCGVMAQYCGEVFAHACREAVPRLIQIVADPEARSETNICATENAISAVGKIIKFCPSSINAAEVVPMWVSWLPIWEDKDEMEAVYGLLCDLLESNSPYALGEGSSNLPRIVYIIAETLNKKCLTDASPIKLKLVNLIRMIRANPQMFEACVSGLSPELQQSLQAAL